jgi:hypothetical protein
MVAGARIAPKGTTMIINREHDFGFVHIPKCAGSTVRQQLRDMDDLGGRFYTTMILPDGRRINGNHVPLPVLETEFPEVLEALRGVTSYAIVREPMDRFVSSMAQYLRGRVREAGEMKGSEILVEARAIMAGLTEDYMSDIKYTVFLPQVDFVYLRGEQVIGNVYPMDRLDPFFDRLESRHGLTLIRDKVWNPTVTYRIPAMSGPLKRAKSVAQRLLPVKAYAGLRELGVKAFTTKGVQQLDETLSTSREVRAFVDEFYAGDADLYLLSRRSLTHPATV